MEEPQEYQILLSTLLDVGAQQVMDTIDADETILEDIARSNNVIVRMLLVDGEGTQGDVFLTMNEAANVSLNLLRVIAKSLPDEDPRKQVAQEFLELFLPSEENQEDDFS